MSLRIRTVEAGEAVASTECNECLDTISERPAYPWETAGHVMPVYHRCAPCCRRYDEALRAIDLLRAYPTGRDDGTWVAAKDALLAYHPKKDTP